MENIQELAGFVNAPPSFKAQVSPIAPQIYKEPIREVTPTRKSSRNLLVLASIGVVIIIVWLVNTNRSEAETVNQLQSKAQLASVQQDEADLQERATRNRWQKYIDVQTNQYRFSELGGIYGLQIIVSNTSAYMLDEVKINLTYIKANGGVWRTIEVPVSNIPSNTKRTVPIPDVERGTSVRVAIRSIVSKPMHFYYKDGYSNGNAADPYYSR